MLQFLGLSAIVVLGSLPASSYAVTAFECQTVYDAKLAEIQNPNIYVPLNAAKDAEFLLSICLRSAASLVANEAASAIHMDAHRGKQEEIQKQYRERIEKKQADETERREIARLKYEDELQKRVIEMRVAEKSREMLKIERQKKFNNAVENANMYIKWPLGTSFDVISKTPRVSCIKDNGGDQCTLALSSDEPIVIGGLTESCNTEKEMMLFFKGKKLSLISCSISDFSLATILTDFNEKFGLPVYKNHNIFRMKYTEAKWIFQKTTLTLNSFRGLNVNDGIVDNYNISISAQESK